MSVCSTSITVQAQGVSNLTTPSEEELSEALRSGEITIEEFQLLLDYFYLMDYPNWQIVGGNIPNLDLIGISNVSQLDELQKEQLESLGKVRNSKLDRRKSKLGAWSRIYADLELNGRERTRSVYQFGLQSADGWSAGGSLANNFDETIFWRSRSLKWSQNSGDNISGAKIAAILGNYDFRWGTGLAFGRRSQVLTNRSELTSESFLSPRQGGFDGLSVSGVSQISESSKINWRAIGSRKQDISHHLSAIGLMGELDMSSMTIGVLLGRNIIGSRSDASKIKQQQYSLSFKRPKSSGLWFNAELNTQSNEGVLASAFNAEWRHKTGSGNVRGALWHYPRSYRNLTGGARSGILYHTVELEELGLDFRDRRINQTGALLRSITALGEKNKIETGLELSAQRSGGPTRGDYILAFHHKFNMHVLKLEAGGRTVSNSSTDINSRWRLRAQLTSSSSNLKVRSALRYQKEASTSPAIGLFTRISKSLKYGQKVELWLDFSRYRWWGGGLQRFYSFIQYEAPIQNDGAISLLTKLIYRYNQSDAQSSSVIARLEVQTQW